MLFLSVSNDSRQQSSDLSMYRAIHFEPCEGGQVTGARHEAVVMQLRTEAGSLLRRSIKFLFCLDCDCCHLVRLVYLKTGVLGMDGKLRNLAKDAAFKLLLFLRKPFGKTNVPCRAFGLIVSSLPIHRRTRNREQTSGTAKRCACGMRKSTHDRRSAAHRS